MGAQPGAGRPKGTNKLGVEITVPGLRPEDQPRTMTVADRICELVERTGCSAGMAARTTRVVSGRTIYGWIAEARELEAKIDAGQRLTKADQRLVDFLHNFDRAQSTYIATQLDIHEQIARGGLTTAEITEEVDPQDLVVGPDGQERPRVLKRKVKTTRLLPDAAAIRWNLERKSRADARAGIDDENLGPQVGVTLAGGVEVEDRTAEKATALADEAERAAEAFLRGIDAGRSFEADRAGEAAGNGAGGG